MNLFLKEFDILSRLDHPNIISVKEIWQNPKLIFLITDFCEGGDLLNYLKNKNTLSEQEVRILMK